MKDKAIQLRSEGYTYKEIVQLLDGAVSLDWCKKNLKGVKDKVDNQPCIDELKTLSSTPTGLTEYQATGVILKHFPDASTNKIRYIKRKVKQDPSCFIRPDWMDTEKPNESFKSILALSIHLMDEVTSLVEDFCARYPNSNPWSVKHEILKLAFSDKVSQEPLAARIYRNEVMAEMMEDRLDNGT